MDDIEWDERHDAIRDEAARKIVRASLDVQGIAAVVADAMRRAMVIEHERAGRAP